MTEKKAPERFGEAFFKRFYLTPKTRIAAPEESLFKARLLRAYADIFSFSVRRILDAGAGTGVLLSALNATFPRAHTQGIEVSEYACAHFGWTRASIVDYRARAPFDLVVCHDVLQYLSHDDAQRALANLATLSRGMLYLTVLTQEDWDHNCDQSRTDRDVYLRRAQWYRARLRQDFRKVGAGVYLKRSAVPAMFALDEE